MACWLKRFCDFLGHTPRPKTAACFKRINDQMQRWLPPNKERATRVTVTSARQIPLLLLGYSRGSMTTGWAMTKNYAGGCSYDLPEVSSRPR